MQEPGIRLISDFLFGLWREGERAPNPLTAARRNIAGRPRAGCGWRMAKAWLVFHRRLHLTRTTHVTPQDAPRNTLRYVHALPNHPLARASYAHRFGLFSCDSPVFPAAKPCSLRELVRLGFPLEKTGSSLRLGVGKTSRLASALRLTASA